MSLDVEPPDPPALRGPQSRGEYDAIDMTEQEVTDDYRREEVAAVLEDGAWADAFEEWSEHTYLSAAEFETARERGLVEQFDFYWDPATDEVGYRSPTVPEWSRDAFEDPGGVAAELDALGRVVSEVLENDYLRRDENDFGFFDDGTEAGADEDRSRDQSRDRRWRLPEPRQVFRNIVESTEYF
jgi:hypothetical protein